MFDKKVFEKSFKDGIAKLGKAEGLVRQQVNVLSRSVLEAIHATEQIGYVNQMLAVLTPVNRKAAVVFFKHFTGFHYDETSKLFTKKSKKRYDQAHADALTFLGDPLNNMFSWCDRHIEVEQKPFDATTFLKGQHKAFVRAIQLARDNGVSQKELFEQMFKPEAGKPGIDVEALVTVLASMGEVNVVEEEAALM